MANSRSVGAFCPRVVRPVAAPQLQQLVEQSKRNPSSTLFVKFASAFCEACKASKVAIDTAMQRSDRCLNIVEIDSDVAEASADSFGVKALPTVVAIKGGKVVGKMEGTSEPAAYTRFFQKHTG